MLVGIRETGEGEGEGLRLVVSVLISFHVFFFFFFLSFCVVWWWVRGGDGEGVLEDHFRDIFNPKSGVHGTVLYPA